MGNNVCKLFTKLVTKIRKKPSNPSITNTTTTTTTITRDISPPFLDLFYESLLWDFDDYDEYDTDPIDTPLFICQICYESKPLKDSLYIEGCTHFYCSNCTLRYIVSKLQDNVLNLMCPEPSCMGVLNPSYCKPFLPTRVSVWWENALSESVIPDNVKFYCPFSDCSTLVINDGSNIIRDSKCPHCERNICVHCKAPWHSDLSCEKYQKLNGKEDQMMRDLAKRRNWRKCPKCKRYVERAGGCDHMRCRCTHRFCYHCGKSYSLNNVHHFCD